MVGAPSIEASTVRVGAQAMLASSITEGAGRRRDASSIASPGLRSSAQIGLCDAKRERSPQTIFGCRGGRRKALGGTMAVAGWRCENATVPMREKKKPLVFRVGLKRVGRLWIRWPGRACVRPRRWPPAPPTTTEKNRAWVLTVKKTVIRFRPSRRCLQKRVSRINTTTRSTTRASARNTQTVEQARFPPRKAANPRSTDRAIATRGSSRIRIDVRIAPTDSPAVTAAGFRDWALPNRSPLTRSHPWQRRKLRRRNPPPRRR